MDIFEIVTALIGNPHTLANAVENGEMIRLDNQANFKRDCNKFYKCPVYVTKALYEEHYEASFAAANKDEKITQSILSATFYDMLCMSIGVFQELSNSIRKFHYHLQDSQYSFAEDTIEVVSKCCGGDDGEMILTFMLSREL